MDSRESLLIASDCLILLAESGFRARRDLIGNQFSGRPRRDVRQHSHDQRKDRENHHQRYDDSDEPVQLAFRLRGIERPLERKIAARPWR